MPILKIDQLTSGMTLAQDLKAKDGRFLLPAGAVLADSHLAMLERVGVVEVEIQADMSQEDLERSAAYVHNFFIYVDHDDPVMNVLFELAVVRTAEALASGFTPHEIDPRLATNNEYLSDLFLRGEGSPKDMVDHEEEIASFPDVYFRLKETLAKSTASAKAVAAVVNTDAGLSARLLRLVNSPFYGFSASIDSVERAVALVGERELSMLAMGISAISYFKNIPAELVDMKVFWKHSLACAVLSAILATKAGNLATEQLFTAGLLHDVGRLIMFKKLPYASVQALLYARGNFVPLMEAEAQVFGYDHTQVAAELMTSWEFPTTLRTLVEFHHDPTAAGDMERGAAVIQLADCMVNALEISEGGTFVVPPLAPGAFNRLGIYPKDIAEAAVEFDKQFADMAGAFL